MKHRFAVPFADGPDIAGWAHRFGWHVNSYVRFGSGIFVHGRGEISHLRITLAPRASRDPAPYGEITVTSGATLIYDDIDRSMAVSLDPEPEDAAPAGPGTPEPVDAVEWRSFADRYTDSGLPVGSERRRWLGRGRRDE